MKNDFFKRQGWHSVILSAAVVGVLLSMVFIADYYDNRKEARREIENCKFKLRDNAWARRTYITTASEITQNKHLRRIIDSLDWVSDSLFEENIIEFEKNQRLISHLRWIANYNDSVANARIAEFDSTRTQLLREMQKYQRKLK